MKKVVPQSSPKPLAYHPAGLVVLIVLIMLAGLLFGHHLLLPAKAHRLTTASHTVSANESLSRTKASRYGELPLSFETNEGQAPRQVRFLSRGNGYGIFLTKSGAVLSAEVRSQNVENAAATLASSRIEWRIAGANPRAEVSGEDELPGKANYFIGNEPGKWRSNVRTFSKVRYRDIYPNIDLVYYGNHGQLEYDFVLDPGAKPRDIKMSFAGMTSINVNADGDLILATATGDMQLRRAIAYQTTNGVRRDVSARYRLSGDKVSFELGPYDRNEPLVIDPALIYSSYLGGASTEQGLGIAVDSQGSAYLTGSTTSTDFPIAGGTQNTKDVAEDAFIVKLNPAGTSIVYSTYLGANGTDISNAIAVDNQGNAYVTGTTGSGSFPRVGGVQSSSAGSLDCFVTKLNSSGSSLVYSTFLGGENSDTGFGIVVDAAGRAYVVGRTDSTRMSFIPLQRHGSPVYKSTDGVGQWAGQSSGLTASSVFGLTIDPSSSSTIYAASNYGVFKTTDAGTNWSLTGGVRTSTAPGSSNAVAVDPTNSSIIYVGAQGGGVYKSANGGPLYDQKNSGLFSTVVNALAIDPTTPTTLYAGTTTGIFKSTNGSDTWAEVKNGISGSSPRVNEIVIDPTNSAIIYIGTSRGMFKSANGGGLWTAINGGALSNPFTPEVTALAIDPLHPSTLYASGRGASDILFKSTDGGNTWTGGSTGLTYTVVGQTVTPTINTLAVDALSPSTVYAATSSGGIFKSNDGGASWSRSNVGLQNLTATAVTVDRTNSANVYAGVNSGTDAFAARLDASGSSIDYLLNFGGAESDEARGVAVDASGNAYVVGTTSSSDFPTASALQSSFGGFQDAFVTKINSSGTGFVYSTYLGGNSSEQGRGIAVSNGNAYVVGITSSPNFPLVNPIKSSLTFDTDAFVTKLNVSGTAAQYSTYLGGEGIDQGFAVAVDNAGSAYVTGSTSSSAFPTAAAVQSNLGGSTDSFVTKLTPAGDAFAYSTYLGGLSSEQGNGIAVDSAGNAYVIGNTSSADFPTARPFQATVKGTDAFVAKIGVEADLSIAKRDSRDPVLVNTPFTYTLTVNNGGPSPATGVTVTDNLPAGMAINSATPSQGSCSVTNSQVMCAIGALPSSSGALIAISVTPSVTGTFTNTATVAANEPDTNSSNNTASETTKVSASPSISGRVKGSGNNGISGIVMTLSGSQSATTQTDSSGFYQFAELPIGGSYTVTPSNSNLSFDPESQSFSPLNVDQTANFLATTCTYSLSPTAQSMTSAGGAGNVNVTTLHGCAWSATSSDSWLTITSGASGVGSGIVSFSVSPTSAPRRAHLTVAGLNAAVYQEFNSCGSPAFSMANYNTGVSSHTNVRVADLNGDGAQDIVMSGPNTTAWTVLLNNGSGSFTTKGFDFSLDPQGVVVTDLNGDGRPDVAITAYNFSMVRIFFNNGVGDFGQGVDIPFTSQGQSPLTLNLLAADVNRDGKADLLVSTPGANAVQVLLGNGSGGFSQTNFINVGQFSPIDIADFNSDSNPDMLLAAGQSSTPIGVMMGNGSGGFGSLITSGGFDFASIAGIGDLNGDGKLDLIVPTSITSGSPPSTFTGLVVMTGDGTGHFVKKSSFSANSISQLTVADFNNDSKLDVAYTVSTTVRIVLGDGDGNLGGLIQINTGGDPNFYSNYGVVGMDITGDGRADLAVANTSAGVSVLRNNCAGSPAISGRVTDSRTNGGAAGVAITLSGAQSATTQTDGSGNYIFLNLTAGANYVVAPSKNNFKFNPVSTAINNLAGIQTADFVGMPTTFQFTSQDYVVNENAGSIQISVRRGGDLSGVSTVDYATSDGTASARTDYTSAFGTLRFNPGESLKSFNVLITDDNFVEGFESLSLTLSNPIGGIFNSSPFEGPPNTSLLEIRDNDSTAPTNNPVDNAAFFVRMHYHDFLNREADQSGLDFWTGQMTNCGASDLTVCRVNVSGAFFLSIEFQQTGYLVERMYKSAYGEATGTSTLGGPHQLPVPVVHFNEFLKDTQRIGQGVVVLAPGWEQALENNKQAYAGEFLATSRFIAAFPTTMTPAQFVDKLNQNAGNVLSSSERTTAINLFSGAADSSNTTARAQALRQVAEDSDLFSAEFNRAFVLTEFFGYLRRNPNDLPDSDYTGYDFWLSKLNQFNGDYIAAEMVKAFIASNEYRQRFGP